MLRCCTYILDFYRSEDIYNPSLTTLLRQDYTMSGILIVIVLNNLHQHCNTKQSKYSSKNIMGKCVFKPIVQNPCDAYPWKLSQICKTQLWLYFSKWSFWYYWDEVPINHWWCGISLISRQPIDYCWRLLVAVLRHKCIFLVQDRMKTWLSKLVISHMETAASSQNALFSGNTAQQICLQLTRHHTRLRPETICGWENNHLPPSVCLTVNLSMSSVCGCIWLFICLSCLSL